MHTVLSSANSSITIGSDQPFCIIGERINPTGRKKFQEQLRVNDLSIGPSATTQSAVSA